MGVFMNNNYDEELLAREELADLEVLGGPMSLDDELMAELQRVDEILTETLNEYRTIARAFYLTTDEILEYKSLLYSGKLFFSECDITRDEDKVCLIEYLRDCCNFALRSKEASDTVEFLLERAGERMGFSQNGTLTSAILGGEDVEYAFNDCDIYSGYLVRFMSEKDINMFAGYIDKSATALFLNCFKDYYVSDNQLANELAREQKMHSMPVWYGKVPVGESRKMFERVRAYELAKKAKNESGSVSGEDE
jgi:hypothetical protein